jgi:hypothetical protein
LGPAIIGSVVDYQSMISVDPAGISFAVMDGPRRQFVLANGGSSLQTVLLLLFLVVTILSTYINQWLG